MVDFVDSTEEATFRTDVRDFIEEFAPDLGDRGLEAAFGGRRGAMRDPAIKEKFERWRDALVERGWIAPHWPKEYGGAGLSVREQFVLNEELAEAGTANVGGLGAWLDPGESLAAIGAFMLLYAMYTATRRELREA